MKRPARSRPFLQWEQLSLLGSDCVLCGLGHSELHDGLCLNLNRLAGLRIAAHAGFALGFHQASESGDHEYAVLLGLFNGGISEVLKECCRLFVVDFEFLGHVADESCLGHACCHESSLAGLIGNFDFESRPYLTARSRGTEAISPVFMRVFTMSRRIRCDEHSPRVKSKSAFFAHFL